MIRRELTEQQQKAGKTEHWPVAQGETEGKEEITYNKTAQFVQKRHLLPNGKEHLSNHPDGILSDKTKNVNSKKKSY